MPDRAAINAPARSSQFTVNINGIDIQGWRRVDLPATSSMKAEYREGTDPPQDYPLWGQTEWADLIMERGAKQDDTKLFDWRKKVDEGKLDEARQNVQVDIFDESGVQGQVLLRYVFQDAWPVEYHPPTLDAQAGSSIATETLVLTYRSYERVTP